MAPPARDHYAADRALEAALEVVRGGCSPLEARTLLALARLVTVYGRSSDRLGLRQIAAYVYGLEVEAVAGWHRSKIGGALRSLAARGAITYRAGDGPTARAQIGLGPAARLEGDAIGDTNAPGTGRDSGPVSRLAERAIAPRSGADRASQRGNSLRGIPREEFPSARARARASSNGTAGAAHAHEGSDLEQFLERLISQLCRGREIRHPAAYRAQVREQLEADPGLAEIERVWQLFDRAPPLDAFAGWCLHEPNSLFGIPRG